jgi:hypothetical protein
MLRKWTVKPSGEVSYFGAFIYACDVCKPLKELRDLPTRLVCPGCGKWWKKAKGTRRK